MDYHRQPSLFQIAILFSEGGKELLKALAFYVKEKHLIEIFWLLGIRKETMSSATNSPLNVCHPVILWEIT